MDCYGRLGLSRGLKLTNWSFAMEKTDWVVVQHVWTYCVRFISHRFTGRLWELYSSLASNLMN